MIFNIFNSIFYDILINSLYCYTVSQIHRFSNILFELCPQSSKQNDIKFLLFQYFILEPCSKLRKKSRKSSKVKQIGRYSRNILTH